MSLFNLSCSCFFLIDRDSLPVLWYLVCSEEWYRLYFCCHFRHCWKGQQREIQVLGNYWLVGVVTLRSLVWSPARPIFFPRIVDSHCDRIHSSLTAVCCFNKGYLGKQPVAWKEYSAEYWLKEFQENMDRCTGRLDITEILLQMALNTIQSINHSNIAFSIVSVISQWRLTSS